MRRVKELDAEPSLARRWVCGADAEAESRVCILLAHFVDVMSRFPGALIEVDGSRDAIITATLADDIVSVSRLLGEIEGLAPSLVTGPIDRERQQWTSANRATSSEEPPTEAHFVALRVYEPAAIKPVRGGLWTSTAAAAGRSMWRMYQEPWRKSVAWPAPWYAWALVVERGAKVAEITNAREWVEFVRTYSRPHDGLLYPQWAEVAAEWDGVHVTARAVAAIQGLNFSTPQGRIPPEFWDVETTFWVKWCFSDTQLIEKVDS